MLVSTAPGSSKITEVLFEEIRTDKPLQLTGRETSNVDWR
jgi:hypothetical protein